MISFIKKNKEWLFSGVGVVILVSLFSLLRLIFLPSTNTPVTERANEPSGPKASQISRSPVTLEDIHQVLGDKSLTKLQRDEFLNKHKGRLVKWNGIVDSVNQSFSGSGTGDIVIVYRPISQGGESLPDLYAASFPHTSKEELVQLSEGDTIEFEGILEISFPTTSPSPSIRNSVLLRYQKKGSQ
jgi:hypothetical protein